MMKIGLPIFLAAALGVLTISAAAQSGSDKAVAYMGKGLAQALCTSCHTVSPDQAKPGQNPAAPKFQDIANKPGVTRESLRKFLRSTQHNQIIPLAMPNPQLSDDELTKLITYILSLRTPPS